MPHRRRAPDGREQFGVQRVGVAALSERAVAAGDVRLGLPLTEPVVPQQALDIALARELPKADFTDMRASSTSSYSCVAANARAMALPMTPVAPVTRTTVLLLSTMTHALPGVMSPGAMIQEKVLLPG